ncbi:MAG TPA: IclR family transcriptional regulator [Thermohalobaculum sp.]|nr:IclR family transcriptional regulator [Thermohalobaculum sp.]
MDDESERIPTNLRALLILETLARAGRAMSAAELGAEIGLPKATIHRLCTTLEGEGFLAREPHDGRLRPAPRARAMAAGLQVAARLDLARHLVLKSVAGKIGETCNLVAPGVAGMVYLDRVDTLWPLRYQLPVGTEVPFHCTASGKMFLSTLPQAELDTVLESMDLTAEGPNAATTPAELRRRLEAVRAAGHSWDDEEFMAGMIAFAVPVRDPGGRFVAALAFHAPMQRISLEAGRAHVPTLADGARRMEALFFGAG